jgi:hypothetical protein
MLCKPDSTGCVPNTLLALREVPEPDGKVCRYCCTPVGMLGVAADGFEEDSALKREDSRDVWAVREDRSWVRIG